MGDGSLSIKLWPWVGRWSSFYEALTMRGDGSLSKKLLPWEGRWSSFYDSLTIKERR